jgi:hypothetical protein
MSTQVSASIFDLSPADEGCVAVQDILLSEPTLQEWHKNRVYRCHLVTDEVLKKFPPPVIFVSLVAESHVPKMGGCVDLTYTVAVTFVIAVPGTQLSAVDPSLSAVVTVAKSAFWKDQNKQLRVARYANDARAHTLVFQPEDYQEPGEIDKVPMLSHTFLIDCKLTDLPAATLVP